MNSKLKSRKLWVLVAQALITMVLPIVYKKMEIEGDITLVMLIAVNGAAAIYTGANVLSKKYNPIKGD